MKKKILIGTILLVGLIFGLPWQAYAASCNAPTTGIGVEILGYPESTSHRITIDVSTSFDTSHKYKLTVERGVATDVATSPWFFINQDLSYSCNDEGKDCVSVNNGIITWDITSREALIYIDSWYVGILKSYIDLVSPKGTKGPNQCDIGTYTPTKVDSPGDSSDCTFEIYQNRNGTTCYQTEAKNACFANATPITIKVTGLRNRLGELWKGKVGLKIDPKEVGSTGEDTTNGSATVSFTPNTNNPPTKYTIYAEERKFFNEVFPGCITTLTIEYGCSNDQCNTDPSIIGGSNSNAIQPFEICNQIPETEKNADGTITNNEQHDQCLECFNQDADGDGKGDGIWTAIGCIDTSSTQGIVGKLMTVGIGIAGGIALLMILASAFLFATSEGEPKRTSEAKEILTSAIVGLLFIIFSVTILQFIGVNILKIPEFGAG